MISNYNEDYDTLSEKNILPSCFFCPLWDHLATIWGKQCDVQRHQTHINWIQDGVSKTIIAFF